MEIDWSKAPEGATHAVTPSGSVVWLKDDDERPGMQLHWKKGVGWVCPARPVGNSVKRPSTWNGEGLPPVGTRCITTRGAGDREVTILAYGEKMVFVRFGEDELIMELYGREFSSIRTPEQIAAEEREKAIVQMIKDAGKEQTERTRKQAGKLYDAGYRKVES